MNHLVEEEADNVDVPGLRGEVQRRVALIVRQVVVDERHLLEQLQHLHHAVAAQVRDRCLQGRKEENGIISYLGYNMLPLPEG